MPGPFEVLGPIRATIGFYNFASQYQQEPAPRGGGLVNREWFKFYDPKREWNTFPERLYCLSLKARPCGSAERAKVSCKLERGILPRNMQPAGKCRYPVANGR